MIIEEEEQEAPLEKRREWGVTRMPESNLLFPEEKGDKKAVWEIWGNVGRRSVAKIGIISR